MGWVWTSDNVRDKRDDGGPVGKNRNGHGNGNGNGSDRSDDDENDKWFSTFNPQDSSFSSFQHADSRLSSFIKSSGTTTTIIIPTIAITAATTALALRLYKRYLRRIPNAAHVRPEMLRKRSIFGKVTSVGDGDNFRLFHMPGGRLAGWEWARGTRGWKKRWGEGDGGKGNLNGKQGRAGGLVGQTIHIRIAGIDAPELPHFGRPAQPYGQEALAWLTSYIFGRHVRAYVYRRDQYDRIVATVFVRRWWGESLFSLPWPRRHDVGLEMLKGGLATVYEAKKGSEFGGLEDEYRRMETWAKKKGIGIWANEKRRISRERSGKQGNDGDDGWMMRWLTRFISREWWWGKVQGEEMTSEKFESPREYKSRMLELEKEREREKGRRSREASEEELRK